jgi:predicted dehydrogenase
VKVYAQARIDEKFNVDLTAGGVLSFEDGIQALFDCGFETPGEEFYEIIGTAGKLKVNYPYRPDKNPNGIGAVTLEKPGEDPVVFKVPGEQYKLEVEHFSKCVLEGSEPRYAGGETLKNMRVIDACLRSIRSGQAVSLGGR